MQRLPQRVSFQASLDILLAFSRSISIFVQFECLINKWCVSTDVFWASNFTRICRREISSLCPVSTSAIMIYNSMVIGTRFYNMTIWIISKKTRTSNLLMKKRTFLKWNNIKVRQSKEPQLNELVELVSRLMKFSHVSFCTIEYWLGFWWRLYFWDQTIEFCNWECKCRFE